MVVMRGVVGISNVLAGVSRLVHAIPGLEVGRCPLCCYSTGVAGFVASLVQLKRDVRCQAVLRSSSCLQIGYTASKETGVALFNSE